jgi:predicted alpha/beta-fold hydrolase
MGPVYQKFFVKRYIEETVKRHKIMQHWEDIGLVNLQDVYRAKNLWEFHERITVKIVQEKDVYSLFQRYSIGGEVGQLKTPSLFMNATDDPIVSSVGIPAELKQNPNVTFMLTKSGGHVCWYEGISPKRWYPKPTINFLNKLRDR